MQYKFDNFVLDTEKNLLRNGTEHISENQKIILLLTLLIERYPDCVSKNEINALLWPHTVVGEASLSRLIADIRQILKDTGKEQKYIKTIHGRGFRFSIPATPIELERQSSHPPPSLFTKPQRLLAALIVLIVIATVITVVNTPNDEFVSEATTDNGVRIAILPVQNYSRDVKDSWVSYGLMSIIAEQLGVTVGTESIPAFKILDALNSMDLDVNAIDSFNKEQFELLCRKVACTHVIKITSNIEDKQSVLKYKLFSQGATAKESTFVADDLSSTAKLLLVDLSQYFGNRSEVTVNLDTVFTQDPIANRNYAIGKSDQLSGELISASVFFELALTRVPNFFQAKFDLALVKIKQGLLAESEVLLKELEAEVKTREQEIQVNQVKADLYLYQGRLKDSILISQTLIQHWDESESWLMLANGLSNIGAALSHRGMYEEARQYFEKSLRISEKINDYSEASRTYLFLGYSWFFLEEYEKAKANFQESLAYAIKGSNNRRIYTARSAIADVRMEIGDFEGLEEEVVMLIGEYEKIGDRTNRFAEVTRRAKLSFLKGNHSEAEKRILYAISQLEATEHTTLKSWTHSLAARIYLKSGEFDKAQYHYGLSRTGEWNDTRSSIILIGAELKMRTMGRDAAADEIAKMKMQLASSWNSHHERRAQDLLQLP